MAQAEQAPLGGPQPRERLERRERAQALFELALGAREALELNGLNRRLAALDSDEPPALAYGDRDEPSEEPL